MGRLHRPRPKSCVVRCREQGEWRNQLDIVMRVKTCACCSADCRGSEQSEKRCSFRSSPSPNLILISARHYRPDHERQTGSEKGQRLHDSLLPKNMGNVMIGNCPIERVMKNALLPK